MSMDSVSDDGRLRLLTNDMGDHLVIRTYFGAGTLEDFISACITAVINAGKPGVFQDEMGVETWFHHGSNVAERSLYMRKQRTAQKAAIPIWAKVFCRIRTWSQFDDFISR